MSNEKLAEQLNMLKEACAKWEKELAIYTKWAVDNDGVISASEKKEIERRKADIAAIKARIAQIETAKGIKPQEEKPKNKLGITTEQVKDKLSNFFAAFDKFTVVVDGSTIEVETTYFMNSNDGRSHKWDGNTVTAGKGSPKEVQDWLQNEINKGKTKSKDPAKLRQYMKDNKIGVDCSGFVSQALNHVADKEGDMDYGSDDEFKPDATGSGAFTGNKFTKIAPANVQIGDTLYFKNPKAGGINHIRIVGDVKTENGAVFYTIFESAGSVGPRKMEWKFEAGKLMENSGSKWVEKSNETFYRWKELEMDVPSGGNAGQGQQEEVQNSTSGEPAATTLSASVGRGGANKKADVLLVEQLLNKNGASLKEDGDCGAKTIAAIEKFQKNPVELTSPDGRIDPGGKTWNTLNSSGAQQAQNTGGQQPQNTGNEVEQPQIIETAPTPVSNISASVGKGGSNKKADVMLVQQLLNKKNASLKEDGDCGAKTIAAIEKFQKNPVGITSPDGRIDTGGKTWNALISNRGGQQPQTGGGEQPQTGGNQAVQPEENGNQGVPPLVQPNAQLSAQVGTAKANKPGDVAAIQSLLNKNGFSFSVDGIFTPTLAAAIEKFQKDEVGLSKPDGVVDPGGKTWNALNGVKPGAPPAGPLNKPNWIKIAEAEIGQKEKAGNEHNPRIIEYHATTGKFKDDETACCSSFVNWVMQKAGQGSTNSAAAVSWARWGKKVSKPAYGAIAVIDWDGPGPGWKGHVGFVVGVKGSSVLLLGGNQSNSVNVASFGTSKIIAYVYPSNFEIPDNFYTFGEAIGDFGGDTDISNTR